MAIGLASAGTAEEEEEEDEDERRTRAGRRRPARVAAATRRAEIMTFDLSVLSAERIGELAEGCARGKSRVTRQYEKGNHGFFWRGLDDARPFRIIWLELIYK